MPDLNIRVMLLICLAITSTGSLHAQNPPEGTGGGSECGSSADDWCPGPPEDPCSLHKSVADCKQDARCEGLPFVGRSVTACEFDERCFAKNCPTVGCLSNCELMDEPTCARYSTRCELASGKCKKKFPCPQKYNVPSGQRAALDRAPRASVRIPIS